MISWRNCSRHIKLVILAVVYSIILHMVHSNPSDRLELWAPDFSGAHSHQSVNEAPKELPFKAIHLTLDQSVKPESEKNAHHEPSVKANQTTDSVIEPISNPMFSKNIMEITRKVLKKYSLKKPFGLYVCELQTGYEYGIHANHTVLDPQDGNRDGYFRAASVVKLQAAYALYRMIEKEELDGQTTWVDPVTGETIHLLEGLHKMVSKSDNDLFNSMLRFLGREKLNQTLEEYGICNSPVYGEISPAIGYSRENNLVRHGTVKVGGKITPRDMGMILKAVYNEKDTNPHMDFFNEALLENIYDSRIPRGIGKKYLVAHKTGTAEAFGVYNDTGIIYCKNPYILVVLTKGENASRAQGFIRELSKQLTGYMDTRKIKPGMLRYKNRTPRMGNPGNKQR